jgi:hypothetical protein
MVSEKLCVLGDSVARDRLDPIGRRRVLPARTARGICA